MAGKRIDPESLDDAALAELLAASPRARPPEVPLAAVFERWRGKRRRTLVWSGVATAGIVLAVALVFTGASPQEPPAYLRIRVVDANSPEGTRASAVDGSSAADESSDGATFVGVPDAGAGEGP